MLTIVRLHDWFASKIGQASLSDEVKAYTVGVLSKKIDVIDTSIVMEYASACESGEFVKFQKIGDSVLFVSIIHPEFVEQNLVVNQTIAMMAYQSCHRILDRKWPVYEELSDRLPYVASSVRNVLFVP